MMHMTTGVWKVEVPKNKYVTMRTIIGPQTSFDETDLLDLKTLVRSTPWSISCGMVYPEWLFGLSYATTHVAKA
eukprot:4387331-Pyramimonas_sp.AAC.1